MRKELREKGEGPVRGPCRPREDDSFYLEGMGRSLDGTKQSAK